MFWNGRKTADKNKFFSYAFCIQKLNVNTNKNMVNIRKIFKDISSLGKF